MVKTMSTSNPFDAIREFETSDGSNASFASLNVLEENGHTQLSSLPYSIRILLEAALRKCDGFLVTEEDVKRIAAWSPTQTPGEIPFITI